MNTYHLSISSVRQHALTRWGAPTVTEDAVAQVVADAAIHSVTQNGFRDYSLVLELQRSTHEEALNDILVGVQRLGYTIVNGTITEWTDRTVETAVAGALGGGGLGLASNNLEVTVVAGLAGMIAGAIVGSQLRKVENVYRVQWVYPSGWQFTDVPPHQWSPRPVPQPQ